MMSNAYAGIFDYVYDYRATLVSFVAIIISTVAILGSSLRQRRKKKEGIPECKPAPVAPICFDCTTQSQYSYTLTLKWGNPRVVPVATWKLLQELPEVCRFTRGANPFYSEPITTAGALERTEKAANPKAKAQANTVIPNTSERTEVPEEGNRAAEEEEVTPDPEVIHDPPASSS